MVPVLERLQLLNNGGLTGPMISKEFPRKKVALLQRHKRPVWCLGRTSDRMRRAVDGLHGPALMEL